MTASIPTGANVILVDGECVFCNRVVSFILRHDARHVFFFAHLQSGLAKELLARHGQRTDDIDSVYVVLDAGTTGERLLRDGSASRAIWPRLFWFARILRWMPLPLLDAGYRAFARRRYRLFGKYSACHVPTPLERGRFLDAHDSTRARATPRA